MARKTRDDPESDAAELLAAPQRAKLDGLLDVIRHVNPTGLDLPMEDTRRRYALKSRLQSLLIRRFVDELEIVLEPDRDGVVRLRHRFADRGSAAHAVIDELDVDARSIVRRRLDQGAGAADEHPASDVDEEPDAGEHAHDHAETVESLFHLGDVALAEFDFVAARSNFETAFSRSRGSLAAGRKLLGFLVENVADYEAAVDAGDGLDEDASDEPALRALVALAAARIGLRPVVAQWLRGVDDSRAGPVHVALAESALGAGDDDAAAIDIERARLAHAPAADILRLTGELQRVRKRRWASAEADVDLFLASGDFDRAEREANAILAQWPDAPTARRVLAAVRERRRDQERERLLVAGDRALAAGDLSVAKERATAARAIGGDTAALDAKIAARVDEARRQREASLVSRIVAATTRSPTSEALHSYLELPEQLRSGVRKGASQRMLEWLELAAAGGIRDDANVVDAVLALERTASVGDPEAILGALSPHEGVLDRVAFARDMLARARGTIQARRAQAANEQLKVAAAALDAGRLGEASRLVVDVDVPALDGRGREEHARLKAAVERREDLRRRAASLEERLGAGDLLGAHDEVDALLEIATGDERSVWESRRAEIAARVARAWPIYEFAVEGSPIASLAHAGAHVLGESGQFPCWYGLAQNDLVFAFSFSTWVFIWIVDVDTKQLRRARVLRVPGPFDDVVAVTARNGVWLVGTTRVCAVDGEGRHVRVWRDLADAVASPDEVEGVLAFPDLGYAWALMGVRTSQPTCVIDIRRWTVRRYLAAPIALGCLTGGRQPVVAMFNGEGAVRLFDPSGNIREEISPRGLQVHAVATHPIERMAGHLLAVVSAPSDNVDQSLPLALIDLSRHGGRCELPDSDSTRPHALVVAADPGVAVVAWLRAGDLETTSVHGFRSEGNAVIPIWQTEARHSLVFAHDLAGRRAIAMFATAGGLGLSEIGREAPPLNGVSGEGRVPSLSAPFFCEPLQPDLSSEDRELIDRFKSLASFERPHAIEQLRDSHPSKPELLAALASHLESSVDLVRHLEWVAERHPQDPFVAVRLADAYARADRWVEVRARLEPYLANPLSIPIPVRRHYHHLLGIAFFRAGHPGAVQIIDAGTEEERGFCRLEECFDWILAFDEPPSEEVGTSEVARLPRRLAHAIRVADNYLARGDQESARRLLEVPAILAANEGQSLARLTTAWLAIEPADDLGRLAKAASLARFCGWHESIDLEEQVYIPSATWDDDRLAGLHLEAVAWMNQHFGGGSESA